MDNVYEKSLRHNQKHVTTIFVKVYHLLLSYVTSHILVVTSQISMETISVQRFGLNFITIDLPLL